MAIEPALMWIKARSFAGCGEFCGYASSEAGVENRLRAATGDAADISVEEQGKTAGCPPRAPGAAIQAPAMVRTPVLPKANHVGALSAQLRHRLSGAKRLNH